MGMVGGRIRRIPRGLLSQFYTELTPVKIYDLSGWSNHGVPYNGVKLVWSSKWAMSFTGGEDYVETLDSVDLDLTTHGVTLEVVVYPFYRAVDPSWASWQLIGKWAKLALGLKGGRENVQLGMYLSGNANWYSIGDKWRQWIHVCAVYEANSTTRHLYVNGQYLATDTSGSVVDATDKVIIGKNNYTSIPYGYIALGRIYKRELDESEIENNYGAVFDKTVMPVIDDSLVLWIEPDARWRQVSGQVYDTSNYFPPFEVEEDLSWNGIITEVNYQGGVARAKILRHESKQVRLW
ncbi:MAG: hypothetical protein DRG33_04590 [Deltaproteobacteria bacterium]|nr:MAG: hypothetical protein DRG33_04590 [Deltaproteobacteria bacterium]